MTVRPYGTVLHRLCRKEEHNRGRNLFSNNPERPEVVGLLTCSHDRRADDSKVAMKKVHDILNDREKEQRDEDVEELMELYQVAQRTTMEKNTSNLADAWFVEKQMQDKLDTCDLLPEDEMEQIRQLWKNNIKPAQTKLQALCVFIDPRTWEKVHSGDMLTVTRTRCTHCP